MIKKLTFSAALLCAIAMASQATVLLTEDWSGGYTDPSQLDSTPWKVDTGCFGDGLYVPVEGSVIFNFGGYDGDNGYSLYMESENTSGGTEGQGYWPGFSLVTKDTYTATKDKVLVVDLQRTSHEQETTSSLGGEATRTALWLIAPDKSKWLCLADNYGESSWGYNPYSGTEYDYPVNNPRNVGYTIAAFNNLANLHGNLNIRLIANGEEANVYAQDIDAGGDYVFGETIPLNFSENIAVGVGAYARTYGATAEEGGDTVKAYFGPLTISQMDAVYFDKTSMEVMPYVTTDVTVSISSDATPTTVTLTSTNPEVVNPVGATAGSLVLSFASGETSKTVQIETFAEGDKAILKLVPSDTDNVIANNQLTIGVPVSAGVKLDEQFEALDETIWTIDTNGYEYRSYPSADVSYDYFGVKDGALQVENMVGTVENNYWGGRGLLTKRSFYGSTSSYLSVTAVLDSLTAGDSQWANCANLILRNEDSSKFFALRYNRGEGGWCYNNAIGSSGPVILSDLAEAGAGTMKLLYNGTSIKAYVNDILGATVDWSCDDAIYVEVGFYTRYWGTPSGSSCSGAFSSVKVENIAKSDPEASVSPTTIRALSDFTNIGTITLPESALVAGDVTVTLASEDSAIAYPEISTLVFSQYGETSQRFNVIAVAEGETTITCTAEGVTIPSFNVKVFPTQPLLFSDDFSGDAIDETEWEIVERSSSGGSLKTANFTVEDNTYVGYLETGVRNYPQGLIRLLQRFQPTTENPVIFEYNLGPISCRASICSALGVVENTDTWATTSFGRSFCDIMGWNLYPDNTTFAILNKPSAFNKTEFLDNDWHTVRMLCNGSKVYLYLDNVYGASLDMDADTITFSLGGVTSGIQNWINYQFDDVKVYGQPVINVDADEIELDTEASFNITVPAPIREAGTTLTLTIANGGIATFADGTAEKEIILTSESAAIQTIGLIQAGYGKTTLTIANDKGYEMTVETISIMAIDYGTELFKYNFDSADSMLDTTKWVADTTPFEIRQPNGAGELTNDPYVEMNGLYLEYTLSVNYWGGYMVKSLASYKASIVNPLTIVVPREYLKGSGTGYRSSFRIMNADDTMHIDFSESYDDGSLVGWGYNKWVGDADDKHDGHAISVNTSLSDCGNHTVKMVANGETVCIYVDDTFLVELNFPVTEGIRFGLGVYARKAGDTASALFNSITISGSEDPMPNPPVIDVDPVDAFASAGSAISFMASATGTDFTYQWYKDGAAIADAASDTYTIASVTEADAGAYTVGVSNISGSDVSESATLTILASDENEFKGAIVGQELGAVPGFYTYTDATGEYTVEGCGSDIWGTSDHFTFAYQVAPEEDFSITARITSYVNSVNQYARAGLMVREGTADGGLYLGSRYLVTQVYRQIEPANVNTRTQFRSELDGSVASAPSSEIATVWPTWQRITRVAGSYTLCVSEDGETWTDWTIIDTSSWEGGALGTDLPLYIGMWNTSHSVAETGTAVFDNVSVQILGDEPPVITESPVGSLLVLGEAYTMNVAASSSSEMSYQWYKDGATIEDATESTYSIASATASDAGTYYVEVSNEAGTTTSDEAVITVIEGKLLTDTFTGSELDTTLWAENSTPFERTSWPDAKADFSATTAENGLTLTTTVTEQYWAGGAILSQDTFSTADGPIVFEVDRKAFTHGTITGGRCSILVLNDDFSTWVNFSESYDDVGYIGWGYNDSVTKPEGRVVSLDALNYDPLTDEGEHTVRLVVDGSTVTIYVDGVLGGSVDFAVTTGIRFGLGAYGRANGDSVTINFGEVTVWGNESGSTPLPTDLELGWAIDGDNLVLSWAASYGVTAVGTAATIDAAEWTLIEGELVDGAYKLTIPLSTASNGAFYRLAK